MSIPESIRRFLPFLTNTGGNDPEELIADLDRDKNMMRTNVVRFTLAVAAQSQVGLLARLEEAGHLVPPPDHGKGTGERWSLTNIGQTASTRGLFFPGVNNAHEVSDGYHTMGELYDHRRALTRALALALGFDAWRSKAHHPSDQPMFEGGYFIVGLELPQAGTVTYHYKLEHWDEFAEVPELEHAPKWDGAPPAASVERLLATRML